VDSQDNIGMGVTNNFIVRLTELQMFSYRLIAINPKPYSLT